MATKKTAAKNAPKAETTSKKKASLSVKRAKNGVITEISGCELGVEDSMPVHAFALGRDMAIIGVSKYKGKTSLDIRRFYMNDDDQWQPTSKGVGIPAAEAEAFIDAIAENKSVLLKLLKEA